MRRPIILGPIVLVLAWFLLPFLLPNTFFYRHRRPTRLGKMTNRVMSAYSSLGLPPSWSVTLEVRGRRSGRTCSTVLVRADHDGERYLVSMLGEGAAWVRNVRAAGGDAVIRHGQRRNVRLEEVPVGQRAPILKAYLKRAMGARPHFEVSPEDRIEEFERVASDYPVFRIVES
jgi:deazaflavin-dependent oxidoreductase (nitroreductase family)